MTRSAKGDWTVETAARRNQDLAWVFRLDFCDLVHTQVNVPCDRNGCNDAYRVGARTDVGFFLSGWNIIVHLVAVDKQRLMWKLAFILTCFRDTAVAFPWRRGFNRAHHPTTPGLLSGFRLGFSLSLSLSLSLSRQGQPSPENETLNF